MGAIADAPADQRMFGPDRSVVIKRYSKPPAPEDDVRIIHAAWQPQSVWRRLFHPNIGRVLEFRRQFQRLNHHAPVWPNILWWLARRRLRPS